MTDYFSELRDRVAEAAAEGRATYLPAGARNNATALVLIDGEIVGQASTCMHKVRHDFDTYTRFGESKLLPLRKA